MDTEVIVAIGVLLFSVGFHEAAHAWSADRLGDPGPRAAGRVTLNPLKHLDPFLSVILPAMLIWMGLPVFGGGKPVAVNVGALRSPRRDFMLVALAGPGSNLLLALLCAVGWAALVWTGVLESWSEVNPINGRLMVEAPTFLQTPKGLADLILRQGATLNTLLAGFNLIPIPPLDGSRVVGWLLPSRVAMFWYRLDKVGIVIVLIFFFGMTSTSQPLLRDVLRTLYVPIADVADGLAALGTGA